MVILLRHGSTPENEADPEILRGNIDDDLTERGREEITRAAEKICRYPVVEVRSDGYRRDWESGVIVAKRCDVPLVFEPALAPYNIGDLSGESKEYVWPIITFLLEHPDVEAPGGETMNRFIEEWARHFWETYAQYGGRDDRAVVDIVHGTEIRVLPTILYGFPIATDYEEHVKTGEMVVIQ